MNLFTKKSILLFLLIMNVVILCSVLVPPALFWPAIFLGYLIPPLLVLNFILSVCLFFVYKRKVVFLTAALASVLVAVPFLGRTFQLGKGIDSSGTISVLSYNVKLFRESGVYNRFSKEMIDQVVQDSSSIKCLQEFSSNSRWPSLDVKKKIEEKGYHSYIYKLESKRFGKHNPGMAIFSKYPIVNKGIVGRVKDGINAVIYTDVLIDGDTIRVYNIHLSSYHFQDVKPLKIIEQVKNVVVSHTLEISQLFSHIEKCDLPYIVAGDLNESPFSYNYNLLSNISSAFEEGGFGFGFTVIKPPLFLRIDNMFFSDEIQLESFETDYDLSISDHYPIRGSFNIIDKINY